ncbi:MAG TPA: ammonia channel protein, partial [Candidatus Binataceae bacterium]|nr:ammonia channel protein [Candidatus Binataceae bacterium]
FNAGSSLAANGLAVSAFVATHLGAAAAALTWMFAEWWIAGKPTVLGVASGAVAGLVAITPGSGYVGPLAALAIGGVAGVLCYSAVRMKSRFGYDDALDVVGVHGVGGIWGALATGIFASVAVNSGGANGLLYGHPAQLAIQAIAVGASVAFAFVGSLVLLKIVDAAVGLRVTGEEEAIGLDLSEHEENAYVLEA